MATSKALDLIHRDPFFDDDFFTDSWGDFDTAMKSVLDKFETKGTKVDTSNRKTCTQLYRNIRTTNIDQDLYSSQALQVTEKDGKFQCVMDVKDFSPTDLQVKVVEDRVIVEGKYEKKSEDGSSMSAKSFYREFNLPQQANIELVSTALSKDGVLTIKAPKKEGGAENPNSVVSSTSAKDVQQSSSTSIQKDATSSVQKKTSVEQSSSVKQTFSSSSTSSFTSKKTSSSVATGTESSSIDDMSNEMDRLVFTHDNVNLKLQNK